MNVDLRRIFRPVVIRAAHGQLETEEPLSVPRWPRGVRCCRRVSSWQF